MLHCIEVDARTRGSAGDRTGPGWFQPPRPVGPVGAKLFRFPAAVWARIEARRLRIALGVALVLHLLPVLWAFGLPGAPASAGHAIQIEIESNALSPRGGDSKSARERAAEEARAAAAARATAEAEARERAARELAERGAALPLEQGRELTPRLPTAGPVERNVSGDPSAAREATPGEGGEGLATGDGPGTLAAKFCEILPGTRRIAHIQECSTGPVQYFEHLNVPARAFRQGYPGFESTGRIEFFALFIEGDFHVSAPGEHYFRLTSDDGAQLFIDGELVVDNDGLHPPITADGAVELSAGRHHLRVVYFQGIRYELALQLFVTPPGGAERLFSSRL